MSTLSHNFTNEKTILPNVTLTCGRTNVSNRSAATLKNEVLTNMGTSNKNDFVK